MISQRKKLRQKETLSLGLWKNFRRDFKKNRKTKMGKGSGEAYQERKFTFLTKKKKTYHKYIKKT